jgi:hypothetical protein
VPLDLDAALKQLKKVYDAEVRPAIRRHEAATTRGERRRRKHRRAVLRAAKARARGERA